jgi:hypothetical protein
MTLSRLGLPLLLAGTIACDPAALEAPLDCTMLELAPVAAGSSLMDLDYVACDAAGHPLLVGRMSLNIATNGDISGTWRIGWAPGADQNADVGPQVGEGEVRGSLSEGRAYLDLNPGWADNNVYLSGALGPGGLGGEWSWSTLLGHVSGGNFMARRR